MFLPGAPAATLTWDANTGLADAQDGANTCDAGTTAAWHNGTTNQTWTAGSTASFGVGGTSGTVTVSGSVTIGGMIFN